MEHYISILLNNDNPYVTDLIVQSLMISKGEHSIMSILIRSKKTIPDNGHVNFVKHGGQNAPCKATKDVILDYVSVSLWSRKA